VSKVGGGGGTLGQVYGFGADFFRYRVYVCFAWGEGIWENREKMRYSAAGASRLPEKAQGGVHLTPEIRLPPRAPI
jgi:hypothetical protein